MSITRCALFALSPALAEAASADEARIIDGDVIRIDDKRIRLWGIDAPELDQTCTRGEIAYACGETARQAIQALAKDGEPVCIEVDRDHYERIVARCGANGRDLGAAMVRSGWALDYERYSGGAYADDEREARGARRGLWLGKFEFPWDSRRSR